MPKSLTEAPHLSGRIPQTADSDLISQATAPEVQTFAPSGKSRSAPRWKPRQVYFTAAAWEEPHGQRIARRLEELGIDFERLKGNRLPSFRGKSTREVYREAKNTLAIVNAPPSQFKLTPIPPSADFQFHLAKGCPAHCQYCYLAGSLPGAPVTRAYANLDAILDNNANYLRDDRPFTTFEASCYTDPLGLEHLTGSLSRTIEWFGKQERARLRWVTKYDEVQPLLTLAHHGQVRSRISLNADWVTKRLEGGTADLGARLMALRQLALPREQGGGGYKVGAVLAPLMPFPGWQETYQEMLTDLRRALNFEVDLSFELITHRFTPGSKEVLLDWYPNTQLDLDEAGRSEKRNKFGGRKFVYRKEQMRELKEWFGAQIGELFPEAEVLYFT